MSMPPRDPYKYFRVEARELLEGLEHGVAGLASGADHASQVAMLLRLAHTLKGAARVVRLPAVSELAHRVEDVLAPCRESSRPPSPGQQAELHRLIGDIAARLTELDRPAPPSGATTPGDAPSPLPAASAALSPGEGAPTGGPAVTPAALLDTVRLQAAEVDSALSSVAGTSAELAALRADFRGLDRTCAQARRILALAARGGVAASGPPARLQAEAGDLVADLESSRQRLVARAERIGRDLQRLHEETSRLRLIPVEVLWTFLERTARDAAQVLGKQVRVETSSRTPRLDARIFAGLQEALLHLVRNAVAHGIETESGRTLAGKPSEGLVRLGIEHRCDRLRITCEDNGAGIDTEAVRRAAVAKGLLADMPALSLEPEAAVRLLLRGGVSTTRTVSQMSGRGVGLDAVSAVVTRLGGELSLRSAPGRGLAVTLDLPVALSALDVLAATAGKAQWLFPLAAVSFVARVPAADIRRTAQGEELHHEGRAIPYVPLARLAPGWMARAAEPRITVVVVRGKAGLAAVGVDRLLGTVEAIVRPLPALSAAAEFVAGASLAASGAPRLVIEPDALVAAVSAAGAEALPATAAYAPILVVDDSLTTRMLEQSILESAGYEVDLAVSGEEAIERLKARDYALLLVDVEMPGMDGFALVERLRSEPAWRDLPAILVTSRDSREDRLRGIAVGAQDYVIKGEFDQRRLLQRIGELLS